MQRHGGREVRPDPVLLPLAIDGLVIVVAANGKTAYELACSLNPSRSGGTFFRSPGRPLDLAHLES